MSAAPPSGLPPARSRYTLPHPPPQPLPAWWPLRPAETRVGLLLAAGYSQQQAADRLGLAPSTVGAHARAINRTVPGGGTARDRVRALLAACAAYASAHPGHPPPVTVLRALAEDRAAPAAGDT